MAINATVTGPGTIGLQNGTTTTTNTYDPFQQFLQNYTKSLVGSNQGSVPDYVLSGIQGLIQNPGATGDVAGQQFKQIANPLLAGLQPQFQNEQANLRDIMRKNGALQSGASAFETRRLVENQGNRAAQVLASNYVPLVSALNSNVQAGVNAGVKVPQSNLDTLAALLSATNRAPVSTTSETTGVNTGITSPGTNNYYYGQNGQTSNTQKGNTSNPGYFNIGDNWLSDPVQPSNPDGWTPGTWSGY